MPSFVYRCTVSAAPEAVFDAITNPANTSILFAGAAADRVLTPGPLRTGSRIGRRRTVDANTVEGEGEIDVCRPPKEFSIRGEAKGLRLETHWRLKPDDGGTQVEYECRVEGSGLASLIVKPVLEALRRADADHLDRLRRLVER